MLYIVDKNVARKMKLYVNMYVKIYVLCVCESECVDIDGCDVKIG
jgi:hypothetical protein